MRQFIHIAGQALALTSELLEDNLEEKRVRNGAQLEALSLDNDLIRMAAGLQGLSGMEADARVSGHV